MANQDIVNFFMTHCDHRGIPFVKNKEWLDYINQYSKDEIKEALTEYITSNNIPFPLKEITQDEFEDNFSKLCSTSMLSMYKDFDVVEEKNNYKYKYTDNPLGVLDKSHAYNHSSNYFQQINRMKCGSNLVDSPWDIWHDKTKLNKMNWHFWRTGALGKSDLCDSTFRSAFRIGTYTATQFKPNVAKALYEKHNAVNVLDTSVGWGDRLAGFYATPNTKLYVGADPNPETFEVYKKQCIEYERLLGGKPVITETDKYFRCVGIKHVILHNLPSEDVNWSTYQNTFDFYFTSPPYFATEKYGADTPDSDKQSWSRYPTYTAWRDDFFFKVNRMVWDTLTDNAYMMINIIPPWGEKSSQHAGQNLCDMMVDEIKSYKDAYYLGKIGMRLQARPHRIGQAKNMINVEPIWVFRKGNDIYPKTSTFDDFFG